MKKKLVLCFCFSMAGMLFAIETKDYSSMTAHDRISLAVSYYEVFIKWKDGKTKEVEAESYRKEAYKIEPDVEMYYRGELEIPEKTISFDWDSIFPEENTVSDETNDAEILVDEEDGEEDFSFGLDQDNFFSEDTSSDEEDYSASNMAVAGSENMKNSSETENNIVTDGDVIWKRFVDAIAEQNFINLKECFGETVVIPETELRMTRDELMETLQDWLAAGNSGFPEYTVTHVETNVLRVDLLNIPEDFFLPLEEPVFYVHFLDGVITGLSGEM